MENDSFNPGVLDTKIQVLSASQSLGDRGQKKLTYTHHSYVFARLERSESEMVDGDNLESAETVFVTMYKIPHLTTRWRLVISGVPYEISSIDPISRYSAVNILTAKTIRQ